MPRNLIDLVNEIGTTEVTNRREFTEDLRTRALQERYTGFLPDEGAFDASLQAEIDAILARLPISTEQFNADLAARGIFSAGEAPAAFSRDVLAPITREATSAVTRSKLGFQSLFQQGRIAEEQARLNNARLFLEKILREAEIKAQEEANRSNIIGGFFGGVGDIASSFIER